MPRTTSSSQQATARLAARIGAMPREELAAAYLALYPHKTVGHTYPTLGYLRSRVLAATVRLAERPAERPA